MFVDVKRQKLLYVCDYAHNCHTFSAGQFMTPMHQLESFNLQRMYDSRAHIILRHHRKTRTSYSLVSTKVDGRIFMAEMEKGHVPGLDRWDPDIDELQYFRVPQRHQPNNGALWCQRAKGAGRPDDLSCCL